MELLQYTFFRHALIGALLISICCGIIGTYIVTRRRVFIAGGITHASLGGLGLGVFLGINPSLTAIIFAAAAAIATQWLSHRRNVREDSAIAICWSLGMALGIIFIFLTPGYTPNLTEYLFGNILTISTTDLLITGIFTFALTLFSFICQRPILYIAFDAEFARLQGFRASLVEYVMTLLAAITIVLAIRLIGIVLLLSVLTLPQMMVNLFCHDYRKMVWLSSGTCLIGCTGGLFLSFWLNVPAGACIVSFMVVAYLLLRGCHPARAARQRKRPSAAGIFWGIGLLSALFLSGCATNTALNRRMRSMTTRYNIHFNGNEAYKAGLIAMEQGTGDDYSQRLQLHPVYSLVGQEEVKANANFDRAIDKCKKSVTTKSITKRPQKRKGNDPEYKEFLKRGEFNPYLHNAWLLSGKAQFYKGDFNAAAATFAYTARHFWWKPLTISECHIWTARCHAVQGYTYDAEAELDLVISHKKYKNQQELSRLPEYQNLPVSLQREFSLASAEICLQRDGEEAAAISYLQNARKAFLTKEQKIRTSYLIAQLQQVCGENEQAYKTYSRIIGSAKNYNTQFNARMARITVLPTADPQKVERQLTSMRRQSRNKEYLDQIYCAIGNVRLARKDTAKAIENYELALEKSTRNGMDKAVAALKLGEVTFSQGDYVKAQKAYSTAMSILKPEYREYKEIARLSAVLDELQTHAETVQLQDSLLRLASLSDKELDKIIEKIIADLIEQEKKDKEAELLAEYENRKGQNVDPLAQQQPMLPTVGEKDNSWYFYNKAVVNAGKSEFQRLWGSRKPEDDWRRRNKTSTISWGDDAADAEATTAENTDDPTAGEAETAQDNSADDTGNDGNTENKDANAEIDSEKASDPHNKEYYLAQIPRTQEEIDNSNRLIEDGIYNMGVIINEKLENFPLSIATFLDLEKRYPETAYRLEFYYAIYLMYMRMNRPDEAEAYRRKLMGTFPESAYAVAVSDPHYIETLRNMSARQDSLYMETYKAYIEGETSAVHRNYTFIHEKWPLSPLMPKFLFLHALSFVQDGNITAFKEALEQLTALYPDSDVSPLASLMVKGVQEGRAVQSGAAPRGLLWTTSLKMAGDSASVAAEAEFVDDPNLPHLLLLAYATDSISQNDLLFEVAKFNFENYLIKDFDLEIINTGLLSLLVIRGFDNYADLLDYREKMTYRSGLVLPAGVTAINISETNFRTLLEGRTFEEYFQFIGEDVSGNEETDASYFEDDTEEDAEAFSGEEESDEMDVTDGEPTADEAEEEFSDGAGDETNGDETVSPASGDNDSEEDDTDGASGDNDDPDTEEDETSGNAGSEEDDVSDGTNTDGTDANDMTDDAENHADTSNGADDGEPAPAEEEE